jgi:hypothetical protein
MVRDNVDSLLNASKANGAGMTMTPFGLLESINEIKSNGAIKRWLESDRVPVSERRALVEILNRYEETVRSVSGFTQADLTKLTEKTWKPHPYFTGGIPAEVGKGSEISIEE